MVKPFSLLATVYDDIMSDIEYEAWVDFIVDLLEQRAWKKGQALDLGCGTGNATLPMFAKGISVVGLDASEDMLSLAKEKLPPVKFIQADFTTFQLDDSFALVYSVFDCLNNLLDPNDFLKMASCVYKHLQEDGFFVFDANTTEGLKYLWQSGRAEGYVNDVHYCWDHYFDEATGLAKVEAYCEKDGKAFTEVHYERAYDAPELIVLLTEAGFRHIEVLSYPEGEQAAENEDRIWMLAQK